MRNSLQYIAAAILLTISLVMPLACDAARLLDLADSVKIVHLQSISSIDDGGCPCPECPLEHHCENDCCSGYAPMHQNLTIAYSPMLGYLSSFSISTKLPQVYFSIFVPPQNVIA